MIARRVDGRARVGILLWLALIALIALTGLVQQPVEIEPDGTTVLRGYLRRSGMSVREAGVPSGPGTFLLVADGRDAEQAAEVLAWVEDGGRLVVAQPTSVLASEVGASPGSELGLAGTGRLEPGCLARATRGVEAIAVSAFEPVLEAAGPAVGCFPSATGAYALFVERGRGQVVVLGGASFLRDDLVEREDNARFALQLLDAGGPVVFGHPVPSTASEQRGVWQVLPRAGRIAVLFAVLAGILFAAVRARRLGRPVLEEPISPIPSNELVVATAGLYRRARATGFAARILRRGVGDRLAWRLGIPAGTPPDRLPEAIAGAGRIDPERLRRVLGGPEPKDDEQLMALGRELERVIHEVEGAGR